MRSKRFYLTSVSLDFRIIRFETETRTEMLLCNPPLNQAVKTKKLHKITKAKK